MSILENDHTDLHELEHEYIRNVLEGDIPESPRPLKQMGDPMEDNYLRNNHERATALYERYTKIYKGLILMTYRHPSIVSRSGTRRVTIQSLSTRPSCPSCNKPALTGALERDSKKEGYITCCEFCDVLVHLTRDWKIDSFSVPEFNNGKWTWV